MQKTLELKSQIEGERMTSEGRLKLLEEEL